MQSKLKPIHPNHQVSTTIIGNQLYTPQAKPSAFRDKRHSETTALLMKNRLSSKVAVNKEVDSVINS